MKMLMRGLGPWFSGRGGGRVCRRYARRRRLYASVVSCSMPLQRGESTSSQREDMKRYSNPVLLISMLSHLHWTRPTLALITSTHLHTHRAFRAAPSSRTSSRCGRA
jgi:hypothetical protein